MINILRTQQKMGYQGYQLVEYLYCDAVTGQHLGCVTNIPFDNEGYCEALVSVPTVPDTYGGYYKAAIGSISTGNILNGCGYQGYAKRLLIWASYGQSSAGSFDMENIGIVKMKLVCVPFKLFIYDESEDNLLYEYSYWASANKTEGNIILMNSSHNSSSTAWFGKFYGAKAFHSNGEMYANFLPFRRKSDNMVGFFETITEQFFEMRPYGTTLGVFAGPDIIE